MAEGRRGLGRGLSALLDEAETASAADQKRAVGTAELPIDLIHRNPDQPRRRFSDDELDELAASIRERGVLQPILVRKRPNGEDGYQIVAGERRWRAAQRAGLRMVPALVRDLGDSEVMEIALIENLQREDLRPLEEAHAYQSIIERFGHTQEALADIVGKSRSHIANTLRLRRLPPSVQSLLEDGSLTAGHARALLDVPGADALAREIVDRGLNVRQTEALARRGPARAGRKPKPDKDADTRALENDLAEILGLGVEIHIAKNGAGEVRIRYAALEQLDDLCRRLTRAG